MSGATKKYNSRDGGKRKRVAIDNIIERAEK